MTAVYTVMTVVKLYAGAKIAACVSWAAAKCDVVDDSLGYRIGMRRSNWRS